MAGISFDRVTALFGVVNHESAGRVLREIVKLYQENPNEPITLLICSNGGLVDAGFMLIDLLMTLNCNLITVGTGAVGSMAIPIFMCGKDRVITPHTRFFFHEVGYVPSGEQRITITATETRFSAFKKLESWYVDFIQKRTGEKISSEELNGLVRSENYLYPEELIEKGIALRIKS